MPKVNYVRARKDYPDHGIKKGDMYYTWNLLLGPRSSKTFRSKTQPKRSQLTTSEFLSTVYDIEDDLSNISELEEVDDLVQRLRDLAEAQDEKYENLPEGLQQAQTGQTLETRRDGCNEAADELENIKSEHEDEWDTRNDEYRAGVLDELRQVGISYD